jgi:molecular chaperone GrpE
MPTSPANDAPNVPGDPGDPGDPGGTGEEVAALREELDRTRDRYQRALADLDNYRKRVAGDGDRRAAAASRAVLRDWLEAVDSVERALRMEPGDPGLTAVLSQMEAILARNGIRRMDAAGTRFDPEQHEAIAMQPVEDGPDYAVLEVARSGYSLPDGEVLRPAQVVVARRPAGES